MDDFSDHPVSLAEARADRARDAAKWTPRDVLVQVLRAIDSGDAVPKALIVCWNEDCEGCDQESGHWRQSSPSTFTTLGILTSTITKLQTS